MKEKKLKSKILALLTVAALVTSCGGGGGGGGGSNRPNNNNNPGGSIGGNDQTIEAPSLRPDRNDGELVAPISAKFDKNFSSQSALIGVIDSYFRLEKLEGKIPNRISVNDYYKGFEVAREYTHGEYVALIIGEGATNKNYIYASGAGKGNSLSISSGMYKNLYDNGVRVFNQSFGTQGQPTKAEYPDSNPLVKFYMATAPKDSLFIWATGNDSDHKNEKHEAASSDGRLPVIYHELEKGWIAVTAVDSDNTGKISDYANYIGTDSMNWGIAAIGDYEIGSFLIKGTSFATAAVSGAAGKVLTKYPWMSPDLVKVTLLSTADDKGVAGVDAQFGWGVLNEAKAVNGPAKFDKRLAFDAVGAKTDKINIIINDSKQDNLTDWAQFAFSNDISGDAGLLLKSTTGDGVLALTGVNTYTGDTVIESGALIVSNQINSKIEVGVNGSLVGYGNTKLDGTGVGRQVVINNDITNSGGVYVAGTGGVKVNGSYTGIVGSSIFVDIDSKIHVQGTMDVSQGTVGLTASDEYSEIPSGTVVTNKVVIQADGGLLFSPGQTIDIGDENISDYFNITNISKTSTTLSIDYNRNTTAYVTSLMGYSSASVLNTGENLDKVFDSLAETEETSEFKSAAASILRTPSALLPRTLDSLSGEIYASAQNLTFKQTRETNRNLSERLHLIAFEENKGGTGVWFNFLGADGEIYQKGYAKADTELWGGQVGVDTAINDRFVIGGVVSATKAKADFNKYAGKSESTSLTASVYGIYNFNNNQEGLYLLGRAGVGFVDTDVERDIWINTKVDHLKASHDDTVYSFYGELGYKLNVTPRFSVTPYVGLAHDTVHRGSFKEKNSQFALRASSTTYDQTSAVFGLRAEAKFDRLKLHGTVQHMAAFGDENLSFKAKYVGDTSGNHVKVKGVSLPKNTTWVGIGVEAPITENLSVNASYNVSVERSRVSDNVGSVGFRFKF